MPCLCKTRICYTHAPTMGRCSHTFPHSVDSSGLKFFSVCLSGADVEPKEPKKVDHDTPAAAVRTVYLIHAYTLSSDIPETAHQPSLDHIS
jgi:hypothetical protein